MVGRVAKVPGPDHVTSRFPQTTNGIGNQNPADVFTLWNIDYIHQLSSHTLGVMGHSDDHEPFQNPLIEEPVDAVFFPRSGQSPPKILAASVDRASDSVGKLVPNARTFSVE